MKERIQSLFGRFLKRRFWSLLLIRGSIFFFVLELALLLISEMGWINIPQPVYSNANDSYYQARIDPDIGYVHTPNGHFEIRQYCTDFSHDFNHLGFLDRERPQRSDKSRVIVLGDSFMEGYGLDKVFRISDLIEKATSTPMLNFGLTDKGPTQYVEIYRKYGRQFEHDAILIGIYPENDFIDDDPLNNLDKTRPVWVKVKGQYVLKKPESRETMKPHIPWFKRVLRNYTYLYNAYLYYKGRMFPPPFDQVQLSNHSDFTTENWERLARSIEELRILAPDKEIALFTIPSKGELSPSHLDKNPLSKKLDILCDSLDIVFIDLARALTGGSLEVQQSYYLTCDSHWSKKGTRFVANCIQKHWSFFSNKGTYLPD